MKNLIRLISGACVLGVIGVGIIGGVIYNPVVIAPFAYWDAKQKNDAEATAPVREAVFRDVCPAYRDTSTWKRWTDSKFQSLAWCDEYIDRL